MHRLLAKHTLILVAAAALQACGGGSSGGEPNDPNATTITSGVAVDPYIAGAVFQEQTPARGLVQESTPSDASGTFTFARPLTKGNLLVMTAKGVHNGAPYTVRLERSVDATDGRIVASPLTTLLAAGRTPADVISMIASATGVSVTAEDLVADPMARVLDGNVSAGDRGLLAAAMAVSAALDVVDGNAASPDLGALVGVVAPDVAAALAADASVSATTSAASAVAAFIGGTSATLAEAQAAAADVDEALVSQLVASASGGEPVEIVVDANGDPQAIVNAATVADSLAKGRAALEAALTSGTANDFLEAANRFSAAAALLASDATATAGERDQARFFGALARIGLLADPYSDLTANGLNDLGDVLDAFGMSTDRTARGALDDSLFLVCTPVYYPGPYGQPYYAGEDCELKPLATDSPRSGELQAFLANQVGAGLRAAVLLLEDVTDGFSFQLADGARLVEFDKTDALFLTAVAQGMLATLDLVGGYDLDVDLDKLRVDGDSGTYSLQRFAQDYPLFLKLRDATKLPQARANATDGLRSLQSAVQRLAAETDDPADDLIRIAEETCTYSYDPMTGYGQYTCTPVYNPQQEITDLQDAIAEALAVVTAEGPYRFEMGTVDTSDDVVVDPGKFFAGLDVRALLPSSYTAGATQDLPALFPDPTFGGVLVSSPGDVNEDVDADGAPDLFGYTYFGSYLQGRQLGAGYGGYGSPVNGTFALAPTGSTFVFTDWNRYDPVTYVYATQAGTWSYTQSVLTLEFDAPLPTGVKTVVLTAERIDGWSAEGPTRYLAADGTELWSGYAYFWY